MSYKLPPIPLPGETYVENASGSLVEVLRASSYAVRFHYLTLGERSELPRYCSLGPTKFAAYFTRCPEPRDLLPWRERVEVLP